MFIYYRNCLKILKIVCKEHWTYLHVLKNSFIFYVQLSCFWDFNSIDRCIRILFTQLDRCDDMLTNCIIVQEYSFERFSKKKKIKPKPTNINFEFLCTIFKTDNIHTCSPFFIIQNYKKLFKLNSSYSFGHLEWIHQENMSQNQILHWQSWTWPKYNWHTICCFWFRLL